MEILKTAVVDITTLVSCCHAMRSRPADSELPGQQKLRKRLRHELKCGTLAYIDVLARTRRSGFDAALLVACRLAAERRMPGAIRYQPVLARTLAEEAGSLDMLAPARQDLWRLAHMAVYLRIGVGMLRESADPSNAQCAHALAGSLRRRLRKALSAYARAALRTKASKTRLIAKAREAALSEIGTGGAAGAERLADMELSSDAKLKFLRQGVAKPLHDLALDWRRGESLH